jgi:predicted transcriptional regulator
MISMSKQLRSMMEEILISDILIPADKVAHVQIGNSIEHALLVLTKSGYSMVPVLDLEYKLHGLISSAMILESIFGLERVEFELLSSLKVEDVMNKEIPRLKLDSQFQNGLQTVIDNAFVCVENFEGTFEGILTRREILKKINKEIRTYIYQNDINFI